jgi:hypothetical protein
MSFSPDRLAIADITKSNPGIVTTTEDHNFSDGQVVRLHVPRNYGMYELNQMQVIIKVITATSFSIFSSIIPNNVLPVSTVTFGTFVVPSNPGFTAEVLPIGSGPTPILEPETYKTNNVCDTPLSDATYNNSTTEIPF